MGLPGPGYSFGGQNVTSTTLFRHVGPIPGGVILERIVVNVVVNGTTLGSISPVMTASPDENQAAFEGGSAIITRRASSLLNKAAFSFSTTGGAVIDWEIPVGLPVRTGSRFILFGMANTVATLCFFNVSVFTLLAPEPAR